MSRRDTDDWLPLTAVEVEILIALGEGARHGYAVMGDIEDRSGGRLRIRPGSLYRALARMAERGWVEETGRRRGAPEGVERRRYYRLTGLGRKVAAAEVGRMREAVAQAEQRDLLKRFV